ncbi:ATP-binding cassette domain-containing protein, partial [Patescibacteria group bacterium]|nr:ATP-binding cassette domain-containing protein [Patescibacteria group bacterium]
MSEQVIKVEDAWKTYKLGETNLDVLKGVSFAIRKESVVAIMGASGSGKSTLLHIIGALDLPSKGKIYING